MNKWSSCKNVLCVRLDNMGDLLMSTPAINALKETLKCKITVLTSSMAKGVVKYIPAIDDVIVFDVPWMKVNHAASNDSITNLIEVLKAREFDGAVIFTVFSQNPLPAAMLLYMAGIPLRLAYCRENPYQLLTDWVPDEEPYTCIKHQVVRDLNLVKTIGATTVNERISIGIPYSAWNTVQERLQAIGVRTDEPWMILHPGVSEKKREYPAEHWIETGKKLIDELKYQLIITGVGSEGAMTSQIAEGIGENAFSVAGLFNLEEFMMLIKKSPLVLSVNTGTIHLASATNTRVVVLYAMTNPQHTPWRVPRKVLLFDVPEELRSKNQLLRYVYDEYFSEEHPMVSPDKIVSAVKEVLKEEEEPELHSFEYVPSDKKGPEFHGPV
jgi:ADP-heptose:LPS heptosyltransferase